ncbi:MAG TPA: GtrA family protein [Chitinophagales bacterium]|nr:GtrA family protein [Chitinophagales bacterium]HMW12055.1 GtrA family protein [Chitinophagales bacterium]HMX59470.1 GtrA family protein [Chitinophagales bacterium]HMZ32797.1 GtrA family protein [Chitinophagales bacterium]HNA38185.1 GtrA family protein [Chitinophagales bacterium]
MLKKKSLLVFGKAQVSAFIGGLVDYGVMVFCVELLFINLKYSIAIGGIIGAVINFSINKYWTYQSKKPSLTSQLIKFYIVVAGSIYLKSNGTYILTHLLQIDYKITRIMVDLVVSIGFNFMLQKYWVFRTTTLTESINQYSDTQKEKNSTKQQHEYQEV